RTEVVGDHVVHRPGAENELAVELSAVEQHLREAQIVADRGERAGAAAVEFCGRVEQLDRLWLARQRVIGKRTGKTIPLPLRGTEGRILHAERLPHIAGQILAAPL